MKATDRPRFDIDALRARAGENTFARGEGYHRGGQVVILSISTSPSCSAKKSRMASAGHSRHVNTGGNPAYAGAAKLIARMAALRNPAEQTSYVAALKLRFGRKRNLMKLLG